MNHFLDTHKRTDDLYCWLTSKWRLPITVTLVIWGPIFSVLIPLGVFS